MHKTALYAPAYRGLGRDSEVSFLILMVYEISSRNRYIDPDQVQQTWRAVNELNNRLMDRALEVQRNERPSQSAEAFVEMLLERAVEAGCSGLVEGLLHALMERQARIQRRR
ncbi:MAG: hypothetical protein AAFX99_00925 [Myxococcota bacterium]